MPLTFTAETPLRKFVAYIDPDDKFAIEDKLSQINTLQQLQNVASYGFLKKRLEQHDLHIHALWFDIYTGDIYYFSRQSKRFLSVTEDTIEQIIVEVKRYYSWDHNPSSSCSSIDICLPVTKGKLGKKVLMKYDECEYLIKPLVVYVVLEFKPQSLEIWNTASFKVSSRKFIFSQAP